MTSLMPNPISHEGYHDHRLIGLSVLPGQAELLIESPNGQRVAVKMTDVLYLLGTDVLQGNIIDYVDCHEINTDELAQLVIDELRATGSQYFSERALSDAHAAGHFLGNYFIAVRPIYGAEIYVIASSVSEVPIA